jgi:hypothetical protein
MAITTNSSTNVNPLVSRGHLKNDRYITNLLAGKGRSEEQRPIILADTTRKINKKATLILVQGCSFLPWDFMAGISSQPREFLSATKSASFSHKL